MLYSDLWSLRVLMPYGPGLEYQQYTWALSVRRLSTIIVLLKVNLVQPDWVGAIPGLWTGLWSEIWTGFWTDALVDNDHFQPFTPATYYIEDLKTG